MAQQGLLIIKASVLLGLLSAISTQAAPELIRAEAGEHLSSLRDRFHKRAVQLMSLRSRALQAATGFQESAEATEESNSSSNSTETKLPGCMGRPCVGAIMASLEHDMVSGDLPPVEQIMTKTAGLLSMSAPAAGVAPAPCPPTVSGTSNGVKRARDILKHGSGFGLFAPGGMKSLDAFLQEAANASDAPEKAGTDTDINFGVDGSMNVGEADTSSEDFEWATATLSGKKITNMEERFEAGMLPHPAEKLSLATAPAAPAAAATPAAAYSAPSSTSAAGCSNCAWTQAGVDKVTEMGIASVVGNPTAGSGLTGAQQTTIDGAGKWADVMKIKGITQN